VAAYGDFVAVSEPVDRSLADILAREVSDGIIAPGYDADALAVLCRKKGGSYLVLEVDRDFVPPRLEERTIFGLTLRQERNEWVPQVPAADAGARSLALAQLVAKYTVSNAFVVAVPGQVVAVAAGQQSRVDAAGVAADKIRRWLLRRQPKLLAAEPPEGVKRYEWDNLLALTATGRDPEVESISPMADAVPALIASREEQAAALASPPRPLVAASDGSIPFPDSIEILAGAGVQVLSQPGGSVRDDKIDRAAKNVGLEVVVTGVRLFYH
jgi:phosphoribosylaminoimidazolecarboxamide formyltransferase/IMP cyclohydrolase